MMKDYQGRGNVRGGCVQPRNNGNSNGGCVQPRNNGNSNGGCGLCDGMRITPVRQGNCQHTKWMRRLQVLDFSLQELVLYLDMYPNCRRALDKYHALCCEREQLLAQMRQNGMMVCATDMSNRERWEWTDAPWPWEYDFVGNHKD